jgi:GGDEF domain-containing protein
MENGKKQPAVNSEFASRISYELKRAERYRIFVSLLVFSFDTVIERLARERLQKQEDKDDFLIAVKGFIRDSVREVDAVSNSSHDFVGILCPETSRQGAEMAAKRIQESLNNFLSDYFGGRADILIPVEISSYPDAAGARSLSSYSEVFA